MVRRCVNQLYRHTRLQTSFAVNMLAMHNGRPQQMGLREVLDAFCSFRREVITWRTRYLLTKSRIGRIFWPACWWLWPLLTRLLNHQGCPNAEQARQGLMEKAWPAQEVEAFISLIDDRVTRWLMAIIICPRHKHRLFWNCACNA